MLEHLATQTIAKPIFSWLLKQTPKLFAPFKSILNLIFRPKFKISVLANRYSFELQDSEEKRSIPLLYIKIKNLSTKTCLLSKFKLINDLLSPQGIPCYEKLGYPNINVFKEDEKIICFFNKQYAEEIRREDIHYELKPYNHVLVPIHPHNWSRWCNLKGFNFINNKIPFHININEKQRTYYLKNGAFIKEILKHYENMYNL